MKLFSIPGENLDNLKVTRYFWKVVFRRRTNSFYKFVPLVSYGNLAKDENLANIASKQKRDEKKKKGIISASEVEGYLNVLL